MFESSLIKSNRNKTPAGVAVAVLGQAGVVSLAILVPLIYTEHLPAFTMAAAIAVPQRQPDPAPAQLNMAATQRAQTARPKGPAPFVAPVRIPNKVAMVIDEPAPVSSGQYVPGATGDLATGVPMLPLPIATAVPPAPKTPEPKPAPPPKAIRHIVVGGNVQSAKIVRQVLPVYPALARQARIQGTVKLIGVIATNGTVQQLRVISGHPMLVQAALDAVRQWFYKPTLLNGEPVEVEAPIDVNFTLVK